MMTRPADTSRPAATRPLTTSSTVEFLEGPGVVDELGEDLDELHHATGTPVTARRPWLRAWTGAYRPALAWAVVVRDVATGRLDAAALLCERDQGDWDELTPLGRRQQDRGFIPVRSRPAAATLAAALAARLRFRDRPWMLRIGQLPAGDPVAAGLEQMLPGARTLTGVPIPKVEFGSAREVDPWLGKGMRKQLRKARNRMADDGVAMEIRFHRERGAIEEAMDEVEHTHRAREHHARRASDLDCQPGLRFWRDVILCHAARDEVEIATIRLAGSLAAYVISLLDHDSYRVLDGRLATSFGRYSPGRLLETATLERALADPRFARIDWMNGAAAEKLLAANAVDHTEHLVAASPDMILEPDVLGRAPVAVNHRTASNLASGAR
jgi:CelD/BcsL family acetyltransferase involved in cellulose biosynthesis